MITTIEGRMLPIPVFKASDGREFEPKLNAHYNVQVAIDGAKREAEKYEECLKQKVEMTECVSRLFGDNSDDVLSVLWNNRMTGFARRLDVLQSLDKEIAKLRQPKVKE